MRKVFVSFEVSVPLETDGCCKTSKPDYVFSGEFDKDDDSSFSGMCDLEYKVENLVKSFKALGRSVVAFRKEVSSLDFD